MSNVVFNPLIWWPASAGLMFVIGYLGGFRVFLPIALIACIGLFALWVAATGSQRYAAGWSMFTIFVATPSCVLGLLGGLKGARWHRKASTGESE